MAADKTSRTLYMKRGTTQGDPLSPKIFNAVLEAAIRNVQKSLRKKGWGVQVGQG